MTPSCRRSAWCSLAVIAPLAGALNAAAAPYLYEFGPPKSALWPGFSAITPATVATATTAGWQEPSRLTAKTQAYRSLVENRSRGTTEPPPIWTNAITEDAILGRAPATFTIPAAPGDYDVAVICGTSDPAQRGQYFDFTLAAGAQTKRVQFEGPYRFQVIRLRTRLAAGETLALTVAPRSQWAVNAVLAWSAADAAHVEREILTPFKEWTFRLPPQEWAKWQEETGPAPDPATAPPPAAADRARGFTVYTRPTLECVYPGTRPRAEDLDPAIRLFSPPGEANAANLVVLPLRALRDVTVTPGPVGPIAAEHIEVRRVRYSRARPNYTVQHRYRIVPDALERFTRGDLPAGESTRFWLTVRVPPRTPAGDYRGTVTIAGPEGSAAVPVRLRVLPIVLREDPNRLYGIYYRHPLDLAASATDDVSREYFRRKADLEHADLAAHGTRNVVLSLGGRAADAQGRFAFNWDLLAEKLALWQKHRFAGPAVLGIPTDSVYAKHVGERYGSHLRAVKDPPAAFETELTELVRTVEAERVRRGWPEFLYYPVDEPGTAPAAVNFMVKVLRAVKAAGVRTYVTADPTHEQFDPLRPFVDVWCTQPFAPDRDTVLADSRARGVEYWCYPNHINGENDHTPVTGARMTYGFGFWRSGFRALLPWIYQYNVGDPWNYLDGATSDFFNRSESDGTPVPVAMWEAYREGWTDYRYVHTLEQLIAEAKRRATSAALTAAATAGGELRFIWDAIRVQPKYKHDDLWSPADFDVYRWIVAREILALQETLGTSPAGAGR